jgi:tripartite-type tricarboxylate transporter receptor subunit TctC
MKPGRRQLLKIAAGAAALAAVLRIDGATAEAYPTRPITMVVPFPAGGAGDAVARIIADRMRRSLAQPVVIENVAGADGSIGSGRVARARPDGYTIEYGALTTHVLTGAFYSLPYDVLNAFAPIAPIVGNSPMIEGRKTFPANDLRELIMWLKAHPDKVSMAVPFTAARLLATLLQQQTGTQFTLVPYRGGPPALQDLVAGQIDLSIDMPFVSLPLIRAGSIKGYVTTRNTRSAQAPDIPTFAEIGLPELTYIEWGALFAPRGTPRDIISTLNAAVVETLADPVVRSRVTEFGGEIFPREQQTPEALAAMQKAAAEKWWPIMKAAGIRAE